jgi:hypothetical protein
MAGVRLRRIDMKAIIIILLVAAIGLSVLLFRQNVTIASQGARLAAVDAELSALKQQSKSVSLDLQVKCSEQAKKAFVQGGFKANTAGYENHYNAKLNKCFIDMQNTTSLGKEFLTNRYVFDAVEGKQYGTYGWRSVHGKKYWEVPPISCEVELPQGEKQHCNSEEEFSKLVQIYMAE